MSGNTFGHLYCVTSFGESHGPAYGGVVDDCPPGLELSEADIQKELDRRKPGTSRHVTQRRESDRIEILSGVFEGRTTGTSIGFLIRNEDARSKDYSAIAQSFRPGHGDYTYSQKYGIRDYRGGGRASARETMIRVAAGAIAKKWLREKHGVEVRGCLSQIGPHHIELKSWDAVSQNPFFAPDPGMVAMLETYLDELRSAGDSCGARVTVIASGVPVGWGEPVYGRLDADIAGAMMGINAVKGVEIGAGFASVEQLGSQHGDELTPDGFLSNHAGGMLGGISTGQDVVVNIEGKGAIPIRELVRNALAPGVRLVERVGPAMGFTLIGLLAATMGAMLGWLSARCAALKDRLYDDLGSVKYAIVIALLLMMLGVLGKIALRLLCGIKYVISLPAFNFNI